MLPQQHPKKKKNFIYNQSMGPCVIIFTVMMPTNCVILEYLYFDWNLEGFNYKLQTFLLFFVYFMAMWSYYKAVTIKNDTINKPAPPMDNRDIDMLYKNTACCLECNKWKPIRAHHCSMCGKCIAKMDHHCPWIANCVGLRNHRAFYLFTLYMMIGGIQYSWRSYEYFSKLYYSDHFFSESSFFYAYWSFTSIVLYPTALMLSFLFCYHSILLVTNQTTIEQMKSAHQKPGCFSKPDRPHSVNIYDRGYIANIAWFFDYSYFWWMPFENVYENDGTNYPITPLCTIRDVNMTDPNYDASISNSSQQIDFTNINEKYQEYIDQAKLKYKGKRLRLHDRIIQIE